MGRDKALLPWPTANSTSTLLSCHVAALAPFARAVVVVSGANVSALEPAISACGAIMARNPMPERGQFSSIQVGLQCALSLGCSSAMITPVDCPPVTHQNLELLAQSFDEAIAKGLWAVAPHANGRNGHPLFVGPAMINAFLAAPPQANARQIRQAHAERFAAVPLPGAGFGADMNTPAQYAAIISRATGS